MEDSEIRSCGVLSCEELLWDSQSLLAFNSSSMYSTTESDASQHQHTDTPQNKNTEPQTNGLQPVSDLTIDQRAACCSLKMHFIENQTKKRKITLMY